MILSYRTSDATNKNKTAAVRKKKTSTTHLAWFPGAGCSLPICAPQDAREPRKCPQTATHVEWRVFYACLYEAPLKYERASLRGITKNSPYDESLGGKPERKCRSVKIAHMHIVVVALIRRPSS